MILVYLRFELKVPYFQYSMKYCRHIHKCRSKAEQGQIISGLNFSSEAVPNIAKSFLINKTYGVNFQQLMHKVKK